MKFFKAGTQYGDWKGSSAADCYQGSAGVEEYLEKKGLMKAGETCVAVEFGVGENQVGRKMKVYASAYLVHGQGVEAIQREFDATPDPIPVRQVSFDMTHDDFVSVFKRFEVVLTLSGLRMEDREFRIVESDE
jgi:hypothetical protein